MIFWLKLELNVTFWQQKVVEKGGVVDVAYVVWYETMEKQQPVMTERIPSYSTTVRPMTEVLAVLLKRTQMAYFPFSDGHRQRFSS